MKTFLFHHEKNFYSENRNFPISAKDERKILQTLGIKNTPKQKVKYTSNKITYMKMYKKIKMCKVKE